MRRTDILFIVIGVGLLAIVAWVGMAVAGESRRIFFCKYHLRELSDGFHEYSKDNGGALPPAVLDNGTSSITWDFAIAPYLVSASARQDKDLHQHVAKWFACPSDTEPHGGQPTRSYSMPMFDLKKESWPPDADASGGVGLFLDAEHLKLARHSNGSDENFIPHFTTSMIPDPANTAMLVERISILNALWQPKFACIIAPREQWDAKTLDRRKFHNGKFNYLFVDGHVELLQLSQAAGHVGNGGVFSIRPGD